MTVLAAAGSLVAVSAASAELLRNGGFESLDPGEALFEAWTNNAGVTLAGSALTGERSARIARSGADLGNALNQEPDDPFGALGRYSLSFDFAASDPGGSNARSLQLNLRTTPGLDEGNINLRVVSGPVPGRGSVEVFEGAWRPAVADSVVFSSAESGEGIAINTIRLTVDYRKVPPAYTVAVNGWISPSLSFFQGSAPAPGDTLAQISFQSGNLAAGAWSVVDNLVLRGEERTFEQWRHAGFTAAERKDEGLSGPEGDAAGDGIPNLLRFAFGLEPKVPARDGIPAARLVDGELHFSYRRAKNILGVDLGVEVSSNLVDWQSGATVAETLGVVEADGTDLVTVRIVPPPSEIGNSFARVRARPSDKLLWGVMDWMINPNAFPDTDSSLSRPVFSDGKARMITHQYQGPHWLDFKLSQENRDEVKRIYDAGHCINLMLYFVSCTYDEATESFSYPLSDQFLEDFGKLVEAYQVGGGPLYIQVFPEFELWYEGRTPAVQDAYRARIRSHFAQMADIARAGGEEVHIGLSFMGLFMADADAHFFSRWDPIISNSDLVYINFMTPFTRGYEHARRMVRSTKLIHENWGKPICFPFVILWDDHNTPIFGRKASYAEDAASFSAHISDWIANTMTAPEEVEGATVEEWRTNLSSLQARGLFAFSLYSANFSNKPVTPTDPDGNRHALPSYYELVEVMRATAGAEIRLPQIPGVSER